MSGGDRGILDGDIVGGAASERIGAGLEVELPGGWRTGMDDDSRHTRAINLGWRPELAGDGAKVQQNHASVAVPGAWLEQESRF